MAALLLAPASGGAQACLGLAPIDRVSGHVVGEYARQDQATGIAGQLIVGSSRNDFLAVGYVRTTADDIDLGSHAVTVQVGREYRRAGSDGWRLCPLGGVAYERLDDLEVLGIPFGGSAIRFNAGAAFGHADPGAQGPAGASRVALVPFASLQLVHAIVTVEIGDSGESDSETFGLAMLGAGVRLTPTVTVKPWVAVPVGLGDPETRVGVSLAVGFGAR